jgi:hypothetical protein|tara:strand:+ start:124 stop:429 length:306 start_codon:yes stop_codon:yes gene_type:complete
MAIKNIGRTNNHLKSFLEKEYTNNKKLTIIKCNNPKKGINNNNKKARLLFLIIKNKVNRIKKLTKLKSLIVLNKYKKLGDNIKIKTDNKDVIEFINFLKIK